MNSLKNIPLRSIRPHPMNPRFDLGDLSELTADVRDCGLIEPLVVMPGSWGKPTGVCRDCDQKVERLTTGVLLEHTHQGAPCPGGSEPAGDDWYLLAGHRRRQACLDAGLWEAPCVTRFDVKGDADALLVMLRENGHRRDLTPLEEATGFHQLTLFEYTPTKIAALTHRSKKTVDRRLALCTLPDRVREDLKVGVITLADAESMLGLEPAAAEKALKSIGTKHFREEVVRERLGDASPEKVAERLRGDFLAPFLDGTRKVPVRGSEEVLRAVAASLAGSLPDRTVRRWCEAVGVGEPIELSTVAPMRSLIGLAVTVERSPFGMYDLLHALGYEPSPVELELLEEAS